MIATDCNQDYQKNKEAKTTLQQLLGDPKRRRKWLEDLAEAQALEKGMGPGKHLQHLQNKAGSHAKFNTPTRHIDKPGDSPK